jgi:hypothetical protein
VAGTRSRVSVATTDATASAPDPASKVSATTLRDVGSLVTTRPVTTGGVGRLGLVGELVGVTRGLVLVGVVAVVALDVGAGVVVVEAGVVSVAVGLGGTAVREDVDGVVRGAGGAVVPHAAASATARTSAASARYVTPPRCASAWRPREGTTS